jgi:TPR repeat protein
LTQNYGEAVKWYGKAAEKGYTKAQYNLGLMYYGGNGVPKDFVQAYLWLSLAADQKFQDAAKNLDFLVKKMSPGQITEAKKLASEWKPKK